MSEPEKYLYCGICYRKVSESSLYITSCAHVLCDSKKCGKCGFGDISVIKLGRGGKEIPESIKGVIEPSFQQLGNIEFASKFQYNQFKELVNHLETEVSVLKNKNTRFKELLRKSRVELDKCNEYQKEIERLKEENMRLTLKLQIRDSTSSSYMKASMSDEIGEITAEEFNFTKSRSSTSKGSNNVNNKKEDFVSKMRKFSQSSLQRHGINKENEVPTTSLKINKLNGPLGSSSFNIEAESTSLRKVDRSMSVQVPTHVIGKSTSGKLNLVTSTAGTSSYNFSGESGSDKMKRATSRKKFMFKPPSRNLSGGKIGGSLNNGGVLSSEISGNSSMSRGSSILNRRKSIMR
ncbi:hypothetical protein CANINC_000495 [Pichia inconspicua]|uniref:Uncharacterized protein n=1 Tax=Pichia inconspicua TaxID=52247 RepID=A0A4T0X6E8_9ASCO|nr:hypothetical protein CANINC_000495 [[Candida] inconspicua]